MHDSIEKVKTHFKENKRVYITGVVVAGVTTVIMRGRYAILLRGMDGLKTAEASVTVRPLSFFSNQTNDIVSTVYNGGRGHSGFMTRNLDYGLVFETQADAARAFNISPSNLSSHLNGKFPDVSGLHFERVVA